MTVATSISSLGVVGGLAKSFQGGPTGGIGLLSKQAAEEFETAVQRVIPTFNIKHFGSHFRRIGQQLLFGYLNGNLDSIKQHLTPEVRKREKEKAEKREIHL